jgi:hypothetical protein
LTIVQKFDMSTGPGSDANFRFFHNRSSGRDGDSTDGGGSGAGLAGQYVLAKALHAKQRLATTVQLPWHRH